MTTVAQQEGLRRAVDAIVTAANKKSASSSASSVGRGGALLLTGAGISTGSGLPDYRSPTHGLYGRGYRPITIQQFLSGPSQQRRYFARSYFGYKDLQNASINVCHVAIANMLAAARQSPNNKNNNNDVPLISHCVTQNVDGLIHAAIPVVPVTRRNPNPMRHQKSDSAASDLVTELHGSIHYVVCMKCGAREHRSHLQERMQIANSAWAEHVAPAKKLDNDPNTSGGVKVVTGVKNSSSISQRIIEREISSSPVPAATVVEVSTSSTGIAGGGGATGTTTTTTKRTTVSWSSKAVGQEDDDDSGSAIVVEKARPDGDFSLTEDDVAGFQLPTCLHCESNRIGDCKGLLRPHVVLFGDSIPAEVKARAHEIANEAPVLICAGTSLQVPSAFTFVRNFLAERKPVIVLNDGPTRLDEEMGRRPEKFLDASDLVIKIEGRLEQSLSQLALNLPK